MTKGCLGVGPGPSSAAAGPIHFPDPAIWRTVILSLGGARAVGRWQRGMQQCKSQDGRPGGIAECRKDEATSRAANGIVSFWAEWRAGGEGGEQADKRRRGCLQAWAGRRYFALHSAMLGCCRTCRAVCGTVSRAGLSVEQVQAVQLLLHAGK